MGGTLAMLRAYIFQTKKTDRTVKYNKHFSVFFVPDFFREWTARMYVKIQSSKNKKRDHKITRQYGFSCNLVSLSWVLETGCIHHDLPKRVFSLSRNKWWNKILRYYGKWKKKTLLQVLSLTFYTKLQIFVEMLGTDSIQPIKVTIRLF